MEKQILPSFINIDISNYAAQLASKLDGYLRKIDEILSSIKEPTWDNIMYPLDVMSDELERFWSPVSHLHSVVNSKELRDCYEACLPKLSAYESAVGHNKALYEAIKNIDKNNLNSVQIKIIDDALRDFKLSGVALSADKKKSFEKITTELSELSNKFSNNILDAVQDFSLHITDASKMRGLPDHIVAGAKEQARDKKLSGWLLNLEQPTYVGVITYAEDRELRKQFYEAYVTRASDKGPSACKFDNTQIMNKILARRQELATILGYKNYAEVSIVSKMVESTSKVDAFLQDLVSVSRSKALEEVHSLEQFARENYQLETLEPWDVAFIAEKKQQSLFSISQEMLRPYFPLPRVLEGLFIIINRLYGMHLKKVPNVDVWHKDVECYAVFDENNNIRGYIYMDLFARENKRSGAWMDSIRSRFKKLDGEIQAPIATLTCNFAKSTPKQVATLSHDEVLTLFHECGHCLHHVLTKVDYLSASGVHGVEWDAVELPSQFFENWCWDKEALRLLTKHVSTGESLSDELFANLIASKNFQSAMALIRQLEFAIFDFQIHEKYLEEENFIQNTLNEVRKNVTVVPVVAYNRFQHSFSHIFSGGYAAGYYSYKWAEVLSADAFARFSDEGIFNAKTGRDFLRNILEVGGSVKAQDAFVNFRGREASIDALLKQDGITGS